MSSQPSERQHFYWRDLAASSVFSIAFLIVGTWLPLFSITWWMGLSILTLVLFLTLVLYFVYSLWVCPKATSSNQERI